MEKLTREEMKKVVGGTGQLIWWNCWDTPRSGITSHACQATNPAPACGEYICYDSGTTCTTKLGCT